MSSRGKSRSTGALVPFDGDAAVRLEGVDLAFTVPVVAVSHEALLVRSPESSPAGSLVHIELTTGTDLVQGMGEVAGVRPVDAGHELLIQLLYVDDKSRAVLRRLVSDSKGETTVEWPGGDTVPAEPLEGRSSDSEDSNEALSKLASTQAVSPQASAPRAPVAPTSEPSREPSARPVEPSVAPSRSEPAPAKPGQPAAGAPAQPASASSTSPTSEPSRAKSTRPASPSPSSPTSEPARAKLAQPAPSPSPASPTGEAAPGRAGSPAWQLDPIDPTEVAAVDLGADSVRSQGSESPESSAASTAERGAALRLAAGQAAGSPLRVPSLERREPNEEDRLAVQRAIHGAEPEPYHHGHSHDELGEQAPSSRTRVLPVALLIVAFLAAAWWTRDAWLGGAEPAVPGGAAASADPAPTGSSPEAAVDESEQAASDARGEPTDGEALDTPPGVTDEANAAEILEPSAGGPLELSSVDVSGGRGETRVTVSLSGPIASSSVSSFGLVTPPRFVVKLLGVSGTGFYAAGTPELARIRIGIHDGPGGEPETHLVFDLAALGATGSVEVSGSSLLVRLTGGG